MNLPNLISIARLLAVPVVIWCMLQGAWTAAFATFVLAGISDALDGFIAKRFGMTSELGSILDPLADKALLMAIYVTLGIKGALPAWLVLLVVSRDVLLIGGTVLAWMLEMALTIHPSKVSKLNTLLQIVLAALVLAELAAIPAPYLSPMVLVWAVAVTTTLSGAGYLVAFSRAQGEHPPGGRHS